MKSMTWMMFGLGLLALVAAVVSFADGSWPFGIVWLVIAALGSNLGLYQVRRGRRASAA